MSINFPTSLDTLTNPISTDPQNNPSHSAQHANSNDAIEALEAKVGVTGSAVATSDDYRISTLESKSTTAPTELKISTASKGGVSRCIDDATGDTAVTSDNWIEDEKYGWYADSTATAVSAEFDSAVTRTGRLTLKLSATDATGTIIAYNSSGVTLPLLSTSAISLKPSTVYKLNIFAKTISVGTNGVFADIIQYDSAAAVGTTVSTNKLSTTNDWTLLTIKFTSDSDASFGRIALHNDVAGAVSSAWFDVNSMTLEEVVEDTSFTGKVAEKIRPIFQAVTTTDNVDQSLDPTGAYTNTYALTNAVNEGVTHLQTFTPTKKYITQIGVWIVEAGTGVDWTLVVHDASNNILASKLIAAASLVEGAFNYFDVPNLWTSGDLHFHVYASATTGDPTLKTNTSNDLEACSYIQRYAKKSEGFTVVCNGVKTDVKADKDGILSNAIIDLDNGKYLFGSYKTPSTSVLGDVLFNDVYSATAGGRTADAYIGINGWAIDTGVNHRLASSNGAANRDLVFKVNTLLPIKKLKVSSSCTGKDWNISLSADNITWIVLASSTLTTQQSIYGITERFSGLSSFYVKINQPSTAAYFIVYGFGIEADLDTSSVPSGLFYPLVTSQLSESWNTSANTASYVYRQNKFINGYGVVIPAIELNSGATGAGFLLGYLPFKIDNSQEATPSVKILSSSGIASDTVLDADGEYVALSAAADEGVLNYQVGTGATCTAITKNTIYLSSNASSSDSTQDPSLQGNYIVGVRNQGITDRIKDMGDELEYVRNKVVKSSEWTPWTPTLTWTTGTPATNVVTKARYKISDGVCYFSFYYTADDGNGATALTISLPVLPKDNDSLTALQSQEKVDTTWSNPLAYIDDGATTIAFRSLSAATDTKAVIVMVTGNYEI